MCHGIALINKSHLVESGDINAIRHKYGTDNVEVVYASEENRPIPEGRAYRVISDVEESGLRTAVLERADGVSSGELLSEIIPHANIVSYRELLPRMNDIFIKIVTGRDNAADGGKEDRA